MIAKILVIDDQISIQRMLVRQLQKVGHLVLVAESGREGIEILKNEQVDLVLLDQMMPKMDGMETYGKIKKISANLPVIMITAHSSVSLVVEFMKVGGNDFVEKPIGFEILEVKIQMALGKVNLQAKLREAETGIQAAKQASQLKSVFISSISHELRTPLNAIVVYIQSLQMKLEEGRLKDKQLKEALKAMNDSSKLLTELINDVLDFSKIEAGKMQVRISTVDLKDVTDNLCSSLSKSATKKGLTLETKIPDDFPLVIADPKLLKQVLINLIGNAIKFTDTGKITVAAEAIRDEEDSVKILVRDTGIGISKSFQKKIFGDFIQANSERKGTGLGLAIAEKLVKLMNGNIWVESEPDQGATFSFTLKNERSGYEQSSGRR